jgi:site-specific recombinase XerD
MRKQSSEPTLVQKAFLTVEGFDKVFIRLQQQVILRGQSKSTLNNYIRRIASICLHFGKLPQEISEDELTEYLTSLALSPKSPSRSNFKHMVYGLRYYFRLMGDNKRAIELPSLKKDARLPVILNREELRELFKAPTLLKHRIVLSLIYSAGLRSQEVINLKISDIDFERKTIHIRQSKYKKDRIVPLSDYMQKGLRKYLAAENPHLWLFNGKLERSGNPGSAGEHDGRYSVKGLSWVMREALKKTSIKKDVNLHSLRHSYATHLLEEGVNIVTVKNLLGHAEIATTMIYLHVAQCPLVKAHSPLDTLYRDLLCKGQSSK